MIKFREKWFWALCLAILVHAGVLLVFYLNANQTNAVEMADSSMSTAEPTAVSDITLSPNDKIYTTTVTNPKSLDNIDNTLNKVDSLDKSTAITMPASNEEQTVNSYNMQEASSQASNNIANNSKKPTSVAQETTKTTQNSTQRSKPLEDQSGKIPQPIIANSDEDLEKVKNNAGLLDIDVPTQKSTVKVDKNYLSAKSEVEEINNQLSAAINEVKKRNQQKIDERQQLKNETSIRDLQNFPENLE